MPSTSHPSRLTSLCSRFAHPARLPGLHLPLEPVDLVLDGLPSGLGCQPVESSIPLIFSEDRGIGETLIEGDLLVRRRVRSWTAHRFAPLGHPSGGNALGLSRRCSLRLYHPRLSGLSRRGDDLCPYVPWN